MSFVDSFVCLKPSSPNSNVVYSKQESKTSSPFHKIKVHISNRNVGVKRQHDDSCFEDETPLKKPIFKGLISASPDEGCFSFNSHTSSPFCNLTVIKAVTPPRPIKAYKPLVPVESTPLGENQDNHINAARERLPSPIPFLNWEGEGPTTVNGSTIPLVDTEGAVNIGFEEVLYSLFEYVGSKTKIEALKSEVPVEKEEVSDENEDSSGESFESTLSLDVQVKSKVVVPENRRINEKEWEANKRMYVASVKRHMTEQNGVMNELQSLMNTVATVKPGENGQPWQHPSDLTRRNYKLSRVTVPLISLDEWQEQNHLKFRRFARVPEIHHRSPVP